MMQDVASPANLIPPFPHTDLNRGLLLSPSSIISYARKEINAEVRPASILPATLPAGLHSTLPAHTPAVPGAPRPLPAGGCLVWPGFSALAPVWPRKEVRQTRSPSHVQVYSHSLPAAALHWSPPLRTG